MRRALAERTDIINARKGLDTNDINIRYFKDQSMPALDLTASYGAQGLGGPELVRSGSGLDCAGRLGIIPGNYSDALSLLTQSRLPELELRGDAELSVVRQPGRRRSTRARACSATRSMTRIRALEVQIAAEVANAALTVQSNLKRVEAATAARELAQKRLEAEQSKFEVGMTTNFFVVQAQRDLRDAANTELRALADYRKSLVNFERAQQAPAGGGGGGNFAATPAAVSSIVTRVVSKSG